MTVTPGPSVLLLPGGGRRLRVGGDEHEVVGAVAHHAEQAVHEQLPLLDGAEAGRPGRVAARVPGRTSIKGDGASDADQILFAL